MWLSPVKTATFVFDGAQELVIASPWKVRRRILITLVTRYVPYVIYVTNYAVLHSMYIFPWEPALHRSRFI